MDVRREGNFGKTVHGISCMRPLLWDRAPDRDTGLGITYPTGKRANQNDISP